jgi:hypothetical protein
MREQLCELSGTERLRESLLPRPQLRPTDTAVKNIFYLKNWALCSGARAKVRPRLVRRDCAVAHRPSSFLDSRQQGCPGSTSTPGEKKGRQQSLRPKSGEETPEEGTRYILSNHSQRSVNSIAISRFLPGFFRMPGPERVGRPSQAPSQYCG